MAVTSPRPWGGWPCILLRLPHGFPVLSRAHPARPGGGQALTHEAGPFRQAGEALPGGGHVFRAPRPGACPLHGVHTPQTAHLDHVAHLRSSSPPATWRDGKTSRASLRSQPPRCMPLADPRFRTKGHDFSSSPRPLSLLLPWTALGLSFPGPCHSCCLGQPLGSVSSPVTVLRPHRLLAGPTEITHLNRLRQAYSTE